MSKMLAHMFCISVAIGGLGACSAPSDDAGGNDVQGNVTLRNLTETEAAAPARDDYVIEGDLIPTPSDTGTRYFLLRQRAPLAGDTIFGNLREERGDKISYARVEVSCAKRLFHIVAVGQRRSTVEFKKNGDGPLRSIEGLPLRQEIASFICERAGTPLAPKAAG